MQKYLHIETTNNIFNEELINKLKRSYQFQPEIDFSEFELFIPINHLDFGDSLALASLLTERLLSQFKTKVSIQFREIQCL